MKAKIPKKKRTIDVVIRKALDKELTDMEEGDGHIHNGWTGVALASWISAGVIRAVKRHRAERTVPKDKIKRKKS